MHALEMTLTSFRQLMDWPNKTWGSTAADMLDRVARRLEKDAADGGHAADIHAPELRRLSALLKRTQIWSQGGTPIEVVCQECKALFDAKPGGEPYPEKGRVSHGICPGCLRMKQAKKEGE